VGLWTLQEERIVQIATPRENGGVAIDQRKRTQTSLGPMKAIFRFVR